MRVFHVIDGLGPGGAETLLYRLVRGQSGVEHIVVCLGGRDWYSDSIEALGVPVHHLEKLSLRSALSTVLVLRRLIKQTRADVVQGWLYRSNMLSGLAALSAGIPRIWGIHCSSLEPLGAGARQFVRLTGIAARLIPNYIINCSTRSARLHRKLGYPTSNGTVVHNGYDATAFFPDAAARLDSRDALGVSQEAFLIGSIGRWHPQKDIPNLLKAVKLARIAGVPVHCCLVGRGLGEDNEELMLEVRNQDCDQVTTLLGERRDIADLARVFDLHVLASCGAEAFPNVVAETMLSETPNVVTDVGDSALIVGETGWVVPPRDPKRLSAAIEAAFREWKNNPDEWRRRRAAARERVAHNFSFERMANAYHDVWKKVARLEA